jgi:GNAT superfamily N-acetyltransferase
MKTLLPTSEPVFSGRICLSRLTDEAQADMPWLEAALAPEWSLHDLEAARTTSEGVLISDLEGEPTGIALVRFDSPSQGDATLVFLAMQPERRFRGLGGEAGLAVERLVRERTGSRRVYAGVPEGRGLAVYFWLRLGYRPLSMVEAPKAALGLTGDSKPGIWMLRESG